MIKRLVFRRIRGNQSNLVSGSCSHHRSTAGFIVGFSAVYRYVIPFLSGVIVYSPVLKNVLPGSIVCLVSVYLAFLPINGIHCIKRQAIPFLSFKIHQIRIFDPFFIRPRHYIIYLGTRSVLNPQRNCIMRALRHRRVLIRKLPHNRSIKCAACSLNQGIVGNRKPKHLSRPVDHHVVCIESITVDIIKQLDGCHIGLIAVSVRCEAFLRLDCHESKGIRHTGIHLLYMKCTCVRVNPDLKDIGNFPCVRIRIHHLCNNFSGIQLNIVVK